MPGYSRIVSLANQQVIGLPEFENLHDNIDLLSRDWAGTTLQLFRFDPDGDFFRIIVSCQPQSLGCGWPAAS